jgi:hypothetical protein
MDAYIVLSKSSVTVTSMYADGDWRLMPLLMPQNRCAMAIDDDVGSRDYESRMLKLLKVGVISLSHRYG